MEKITALGTGNAMVKKCYNTCFIISDDDKKDAVLVDAGGGNGIMVQFDKAGFDFRDIHTLIITHEHSDHILGCIWVFRVIATLIKKDKYDGNLDIYFHKRLAEIFEPMLKMTLQKKFTDLLGSRIFIHIVEDGQVEMIQGRATSFFDIHSTKAMQYGFSMILKNGKKLTCLGDEPYNTVCKKYVEMTDILLCEAFCLYNQRDIYKPYEKHHSTVKEACEIARELDIDKLVIWHTEDDNYANRKKLYTQEGRQFYNGNLVVPDDLEIIEL